MQEIKKVVQENLKSSKKERKNKTDKIFDLKITRGMIYTYLPVVKSPVEIPERSIQINCGFNIWRTITMSKDQALPLKETQPIMIEKIRGKYIIKDPEIPVPKRRLFTFRGKLQRVVDGDTLWVIIDCGFDTHIRQKIRLKGINAPELETEEGKSAKRFVQSELRGCSEIVVKTYKADKYDRYLGEIYYLKDEVNYHRIAAEGKCLNQVLLDKGLVEIYKR